MIFKTVGVYNPNMCVGKWEDIRSEVQDVGFWCVQCVSVSVCAIISSHGL